MTQLAPDDRGFTLGHGVFETILWAEGGFAHWDAHLDRLARTAPESVPAYLALARRTAERAVAVDDENSGDRTSHIGRCHDRSNPFHPRCPGNDRNAPIHG